MGGLVLILLGLAGFDEVYGDILVFTWSSPRSLYGKGGRVLSRGFSRFSGRLFTCGLFTGGFYLNTLDLGN